MRSGLDDAEPPVGAGHPTAPGEFAGHGIAAHDPHHALERRRIRWVAVDGEPTSQGPSGEGGVGGEEPVGIGRVEG